MMTPNDPRIVERLRSCRAKFATSLVGRWSTAQGTFDAIMSEQWEFLADGTLRVSRSSRAGTDHDVYLWEADGPFRVRLGLPPDEDEREVLWWTVSYEFAVIEHDAGQEVVLREVGRKGFSFFCQAPLRPDLDGAPPPPERS